MDLTHRFSVPTDVETTWAHFEDIEGLAACFPGATVTSVEAATFTGTVKVKLGPIALVYGGSGTFVDKDDVAHAFRVEAKGKDKRGNGTAGAKVALSMASSATGGTDVEVLTDLAITGKPAQFGRGVMQDVSDKLLGQFVDCLEQRLTAEPVAELVNESAAMPAEVPSEPATELAEVLAADDATVASGPSVASDTEPHQVAGVIGGLVVGEEPAARPTPAPRAAPARPLPSNDDALDLGAAVLPVLLKGYWKQGAAGLGVLALLVWLLRRRG